MKILFAAGLTILILWQMLLPGYILTLDMVFTPAIPVNFQQDGFNNVLPVNYLMHMASLIVPGWVVQKIMLVLLFFGICLLSYLFLPIPNITAVRIYSSLIYTLNPFVYVRMLAGQWTHLAAYGFLPLLIHCLFIVKRKPSFASALKLAASLFLISLFSIHYCILSLLVSAAFLAVHIIQEILKKNYVYARRLATYIIASGLMFTILASYWIVPALLRKQPLEARFDEAHWLAFSASGHGAVSASLNLLSLNGFWGERETWARYFAWPQDRAAFWVAFGLILALSAAGAWRGLKSKEMRQTVFFMIILGAASFILAGGAADTPFRELNLWLYRHVFFWSGFRDSQKLISLLALSYATLAGYGLAYVLKYLETQNDSLKEYLKYSLFLIPFCFGFLMLGGFQKQLRPAWYPASWFEAKQITNDGGAGKALVLPWEGYLSLDFNNNLIVANPAKAFFGEKALVSRSINLGTIRDQETDPAYRTLDSAVSNALANPEINSATLFKTFNIDTLIFIGGNENHSQTYNDFAAYNNGIPVIQTPGLILYTVKVD